MKNKTKIPVILHGESKIMLNAQLTPSAKKIQPSNPEKGYHIIADSETTGNHHVVDAVEGVEFFKDDDGNHFMVATAPTNVRCVMEHRHSTIKLDPGTYKFDFQQEVDYHTMQKQRVRD